MFRYDFTLKYWMNMIKVLVYLLMVFLVLGGRFSSATALSGKDIYEKYCTVCHHSGLAGAPKFQSSEWSMRCHEKHLKGLVSSAIQGINAMPAKGTCDVCQEDDILAAIKYMVPKNENECR